MGNIGLHRGFIGGYIGVKISDVPLGGAYNQDCIISAVISIK